LLLFLSNFRGNPGCHIAIVVIDFSSRDQGGDIRDVISIGKLVRKNDGPEEVEQILSTMIKYGEIKELN
jgi:hypothetical protein